MFFLHRSVYDKAMSTDDPYLACLYGFKEHKNYGNCLACSQCDYCNLGIVNKSMAAADEALKLCSKMKASLSQRPAPTDEEIRQVLHGKPWP